MERVIYADVLIAVNYIINWLLLKGAARLAGQPVKGLRLVLSAAFGAATALLIFVPEMNALMWVAAKVGISLLMAAIAFRFQSWNGLLKLWFVFLNVSLIFAGFTYALYTSLEEQMLWYNGVVYFDISPVTLVACAAFAYGVLWLFDFIFSKAKVRGEALVLIVRMNGKSLILPAIEDTGNSLREPFSGLPVVVCSLSDALPVLPDQWLGWVCNVIAGKSSTTGIPSGCRIISYRGVGSSGLLPAFRPDSLQIKKGEQLYHCNGYLALSDSLGKGEYHAVVNPQIIRMTV